MRQINIKSLRANISSELDNLPFAITKKGQVIAVVCTPETEKATPKCTPELVKCTPELVKCTPETIKPVIECTPVIKSVHQAKAKLNKIVTKKTQATWINPLAGTKLAPKS